MILLHNQQYSFYTLESNKELCYILLIGCTSILLHPRTLHFMIYNILANSTSILGHHSITNTTVHTLSSSSFTSHPIHPRVSKMILTDSLQPRFLITSMIRKLTPLRQLLHDLIIQINQLILINRLVIHLVNNLYHLEKCILLSLRQPSPAVHQRRTQQLLIVHRKWPHIHLHLMQQNIRHLTQSSSHYRCHYTVVLVVVDVE